ncbi:hypothetical protein [Paenibacillus sp. MMS18-CY102]|nr:hypothetical protein [Paenibacillus sp. MMS18-CY102]
MEGDGSSPNQTNDSRIAIPTVIRRPYLSAMRLHLKGPAHWANH